MGDWWLSPSTHSFKHANPGGDANADSSFDADYKFNCK
jgi:hypothetical protein